MSSRLAFLLVVLLAIGTPRGVDAQSIADYNYDDLQFRGLGPEIGWVIPTKLEPTASYGLRVDMGFVGPRIRVTPAIRFWSSELRQAEVERLADQIISFCLRQQAPGCPVVLDLGRVERSDLELSLDGHYLLNTGGVGFFTGGGLSLHLLNGRGEFIDDTFVEDLLDTLATGFNVLLGSTARVGAVRLFAEVRGVMTSDIQYAQAGFGIVWNLPFPPVAGVD